MRKLLKDMAFVIGMQIFLVLLLLALPLYGRDQPTKATDFTCHHSAFDMIRCEASFADSRPDWPRWEAYQVGGNLTDRDRNSYVAYLEVIPNTDTLVIFKPKAYPGSWVRHIIGVND